MRKISLIVVLICCSGCVGKHPERPRITQPPASYQNQIPLTKEIDQLKAEVKTSSTATQNSLTGIGANIGKLTDEVVGVKADLTTKIEANTQAIANMKVELKAQVQVGIGNELDSRIDELNQNVSSGRDSTIETIQFTKQMAEVIERGYQSVLWAIGILGFVALISLAIVLVALERSRARAERRYQDAHNLVREEITNGHG